MCLTIAALEFHVEMCQSPRTAETSLNGSFFGGNLSPINTQGNIFSLNQTKFSIVVTIFPMDLEPQMDSFVYLPKTIVKKVEFNTIQKFRLIEVKN